MSNKVFLPVILALLFLLSCAINVADQNGTGTEAGEARVVLGKVLTESAVAVPGAEVTLRRVYSENNDTSSIQAAVSNSDGVYSFQNILPGYYVAEAWSGDTLCSMQRFQCVAIDSVLVDDMSLSNPVSFSGTVLYKNSAIAGAQVEVMGLNRYTISSVDGGFLFNSLPSGIHFLRVIQNTSSLKGEFMVSEENNGDTMVVDTMPYTVLENFDHFTGRNSIGQLMGDGYWYYSTDEHIGGSSTIEPVVASEISAAVTSSGSYSGNSLYLTFVIDSSFDQCFSLIGTNLSDPIESDLGRTFFNLEKMSALKFQAKGSGKIFIQFMTRVEQTVVRFQVPVLLTDTWTLYTIHSDSIPYSDSIPWSSGVTAVNAINFMAARYAELWLDEIVIEGMYPEEFFSAANK